MAELFGNEVLTAPALAELATFGGEDVSVITEIGSGAESGATTVEELIIEANRAFEQAQRYAQEGNWAGYGEEIAALEETLARLAELTGVQIEPTPEAESEVSDAGELPTPGPTVEPESQQ